MSKLADLFYVFVVFVMLGAAGSIVLCCAAYLTHLITGSYQI